MDAAVLLIFATFFTTLVVSTATGNGLLRASVRRPLLFRSALVLAAAATVPVDLYAVIYGTVGPNGARLDAVADRLLLLNVAAACGIAALHESIRGRAFSATSPADSPAAVPAAGASVAGGSVSGGLISGGSVSRGSVSGPGADVLADRAPERELVQVGAGPVSSAVPGLIVTAVSSSALASGSVVDITAGPRTGSRDAGPTSAVDLSADGSTVLTAAAGTAAAQGVATRHPGDQDDWIDGEPAVRMGVLGWVGPVIALTVVTAMVALGSIGDGPELGHVGPVWACYSLLICVISASALLRRRVRSAFDPREG